MLNYGNLTDNEFEYLCCDIMQKKLDKTLRRFGTGKDGGIDLTDSVMTYDTVVQVKQFLVSDAAQLISSLKKEIVKINRLKPKHYYICCSKNLSPVRIKEIYLMFKDYMQSEQNIITLNEIEEFLTDPQNIDVLRKHYKLWIDSTGILQELQNNDIFLDCEVLLSDIEREKRLFVKTDAYERALECLKHNKTIFITGNPGVGKTITSKMLTLYYAANGYRVRYTTNGADLSSLKRALAAEPDVKEIILVDDCFGQAYFQMKEYQNRELLALIKYVCLSKNKYLILNSRVTIFREAREREPELIRSFDNNEYSVFVLDMSQLSNIEKAGILYNHLYFSEIPTEYFAEIKKDKRYHDIIKHPNYNPRLIEFVTLPSHYCDVVPKDYYNYIRRNLDNPREIWKDEYERKLQKSDRILLTTIYSLSDKASSMDLVKMCFEKRIMAEDDIDKTVNQFEASLQRLMDGFVHIIDINGSKKISMLNPSVNDYMDGRFLDNSVERQAVIDSSYSIFQLERILNDVEFKQYTSKIVVEHRVDDYYFDSQVQKTAFIAYMIGINKICDEFYKETVYEYLSNPTGFYIRFGFFTDAVSIALNLIESDLAEYYKLGEYLANKNNLESFYNGFNFDDTVRIVCEMDHLFKGDIREQYIEWIIEIIKSVIEGHCGDVELWDLDLDVASAVNWASYEEEYGGCYDEAAAVQRIEDDAIQEILDEIEYGLKKLPDDIVIPDEFLDNLEFYICGADGLLEDYFKSNNKEPDMELIKPKDYDETEIDFIFARD